MPRHPASCALGGLDAGRADPVSGGPDGPVLCVASLRPAARGRVVLLNFIGVIDGSVPRQRLRRPLPCGAPHRRSGPIRLPVPRRIRRRAAGPPSRSQSAASREADALRVAARALPGLEAPASTQGQITCQEAERCVQHHLAPTWIREPQFGLLKSVVLVGAFGAAAARSTGARRGSAALRSRSRGLALRDFGATARSMATHTSPRARVPGPRSSGQPVCRSHATPPSCRAMAPSRRTGPWRSG